MARILIVGCGYAGTALGLRLARAGHEVFGARRDPRHLPSGLHPVRADVTVVSGLDDLPRDVDCVYYMASAGRSDEAVYRQIYVTGLGNVLEALRRSTVQRLCFVSSTAVYGEQDGGVVDEQSPTEPTSFRGAMMLEAEQLVLRSQFEGVIARSTGIYGPGRARLIDRIRAGEQSARNPSTFTNRIHRDDLAAALEHLTAVDRPDPVYICTDDEPAPLLEVERWIARALGVPAPAAPITFDPAPGNKRCSNARLRNTGFACRYPSYREGYGALVSSSGASK